MRQAVGPAVREDALAWGVRHVGVVINERDPAQPIADRPLAVALRLLEGRSPDKGVFEPACAPDADARLAFSVLAGAVGGDALGGRGIVDAAAVGAGAGAALLGVRTARALAVALGGLVRRGRGVRARGAGEDAARGGGEEPEEAAAGAPPRQGLGEVVEAVPFHGSSWIAPGRAHYARPGYRLLAGAVSSA